jgi:hypothetical protein
MYSGTCSRKLVTVVPLLKTNMKIAWWRAASLVATTAITSAKRP